MCGLFGIANSTSLIHSEKRFIEQATFVGTLRGFDSTGMGLVDKNNDMQIHKRALAGPDFASSRVGQKCFDDLSSSFVVIGHNRAATRGVVKDYTAHPYAFGSIIGCHNGTLEYNSGLDIKGHPVDSMNLIEALSKAEQNDKASGYAELLSTV